MILTVGKYIKNLTRTTKTWIKKEKQGFNPLLFLLKTKQLITRFTLYLLKTNQSIKYAQSEFAKYCTVITGINYKLFHKKAI